MSFLAAGAMLLGTVLTNNSNKKAASKARSNSVEDNAQQWVRHRKASEKGGFNPLTTMGMSSGQTGNPSGQNFISASTTNAMLNGFVSAADSYAFDNDPMRDLERESAQLRNDLTRLQIEELSDVPAAARSGVYGGSVMTQQSTDQSIARGGDWNPLRDTPPTLGGSGERYRPVAEMYSADGTLLLTRDLMGWDVDETKPATEPVEGEYGDLGGSFYGVGAAAWDLGRNARGNYPRVAPTIRRAGNRVDAWLGQFDPSPTGNINRVVPRLGNIPSTDFPPKNNPSFDTGESMYSNRYPTIPMLGGRLGWTQTWNRESYPSNQFNN